MAEDNFNTIVIIVVCMIAIMACFFLYLRHCCVVPRMPRRSTSALRSAAGSLTSGKSLDPAVIKSFPTYVYSESEVKARKILMGGVVECAVCLNEFKDYEPLRLLPQCSHTFHSDCIDKWLSSHITCPVCRADVTDLSYRRTPINLVEVSTCDVESVRETSHEYSNSPNSDTVVDEIVIPAIQISNQQIY